MKIANWPMLTVFPVTMHGTQWNRVMTRFRPGIGGAALVPKGETAEKDWEYLQDAVDALKHQLDLYNQWRI